MNTPQPAAEKHAQVRAPRNADDNPAAEESLPHHAQRLVQSRLRAMVGAVLNPFIKFLQRLRRRSGGDQEAGEDEGEGERPRSRKEKTGSGRDAGAQADEAGEGEAVAPKPKSRLLTVLIYFNVLLAGGMIGGGLAYELLAQLLERQSAESVRLQAAMAKLSKSTSSNEKALKEALAKRVEAEKAFEEAKKKLETALNEAKTVGEKQKKFDEAAKMLDSIRDRSANAPRPPSAGSSDSKARPLKSADCSMAPGDVSGLKDCLKDFNR